MSKMQTKIIYHPYCNQENNLANKKNIVMVYGHFSSIHPGHIRYLKYAAGLGQILVIALRGDSLKSEQPRFRFSSNERADSLALLNICNYIIKLNKDDLSEAIQFLKPEILVLGTEYKDSKNKEMQESFKVINKLGKKLIFHAGETQYALTDFLRKNESNLAKERKQLFLKSCKKQNITLKKLLTNIDSFKKSRLLIIGDTIVDQYTACEALGMSAEAPVIVVKELENKNFVGGAAIVAAHARALGAKCTFVSVTGDDLNSKIIEKQLKKWDIEQILIKDPSRPTTFKKRYMVENQKLFRVSRIEDHELKIEIENQVISAIEKKAPYVDGIIISDFAYGVVTRNLNEKIMSLAEKYSLKVFADLQCSSQIGSITKFKNITLLSPNEREARLALQDKESGLELLANILFEKCQCEKLVMKLNSQGFIAYEKDDENKLVNQYFPALSVNPLDVTGAGDSLLALMSVSLSMKVNMMEASALACFMSAAAVETLGNQPISSIALRERIINYLS